MLTFYLSSLFNISARFGTEHNSKLALVWQTFAFYVDSPLTRLFDIPLMIRLRALAPLNLAAIHNRSITLFVCHSNCDAEPIFIKRSRTKFPRSPLPILVADYTLRSDLRTCNSNSDKRYKPNRATRTHKLTNSRTDDS